MWNRRQSGMTLVELIIAIVIINVGVMGVMLSFTSTVRSSVDPMIYKQMAAIADGMMEEILLKPFTATDPVPTGTCARSTFNDIGDYNGYKPGKICDVEGIDITNLSGYTVQVSVAQPTAAFGALPAADVRQIVIDVGRTAGTETYRLTGWRTCYAGPPC